MHARGNQLVPELLLNPSDNMQAQCCHIEHLHKEFDAITFYTLNICIKTFKAIKFYFDKITIVLNLFLHF